MDQRLAAIPQRFVTGARGEMEIRANQSRAERTSLLGKGSSSAVPGLASAGSMGPDAQDPVSRRPGASFVRCFLFLLAAVRQASALRCRTQILTANAASMLRR